MTNINIDNESLLFNKNTLQVNKKNITNQLKHELILKSNLNNKLPQSEDERDDVLDRDKKTPTGSKQIVKVSKRGLAEHRSFRYHKGASFVLASCLGQ